MVKNGGDGPLSTPAAVHGANAIGEHREAIRAARLIELFAIELALVNRFARDALRLREIDIGVGERRRLQRCTVVRRANAPMRRSAPTDGSASGGVCFFNRLSWSSLNTSTDGALDVVAGDPVCPAALSTSIRRASVKAPTRRRPRRCAARNAAAAAGGYAAAGLRIRQAHTSKSAARAVCSGSSPATPRPAPARTSIAARDCPTGRAPARGSASSIGLRRRRRPTFRADAARRRPCRL